MSDIITICADLQKRKSYSPDFHKFRKAEHTLVFNYFPKFKPEREYAKFLMPMFSAYLGKAYTVMDHYVVKEVVTDGSIRAAFHSTEAPHPGAFAPNHKANVRGQLYALTEEALLNMDTIACNGIAYRRETKVVYLRDQESPFKDNVENKIAVRAQMYVGIPEYWNQFSMQKVAVIKDENNKWMWS